MSRGYWLHTQNAPCNLFHIPITALLYINIFTCQVLFCVSTLCTFFFHSFHDASNIYKREQDANTCGICEKEKEEGVMKSEKMDECNMWVCACVVVVHA